MIRNDLAGGRARSSLHHRRARASISSMPVQPTSADSRAMRLPVDPAPLVAETAAGERSFTIEIADDLSERSAGLMFRETMDDDHGMLFVFAETQAGRLLDEEYADAARPGLHRRRTAGSATSCPASRFRRRSSRRASRSASCLNSSAARRRRPASRMATCIRHPAIGAGLPGRRQCRVSMVSILKGIAGSDAVLLA